MGGGKEIKIKKKVMRNEAEKEGGKETRKIRKGRREGKTERV